MSNTPKPTETDAEFAARLRAIWEAAQADRLAHTIAGRARKA